MSLIREYVREILTEGEVKFSGILKLMPSPEIISQAETIISTLPDWTTPLWAEDQMPVIPLHPEKFHVTLAHQGVLKPFKKQLKLLSKSGQFPIPPAIRLNPNWVERTDESLQRRSYVAWVQNQDEVGAYLNSIMQMVGGPMNLWEVENPPRRFHVSLANLTGNPGDSVR